MFSVTVFLWADPALETDEFLLHHQVEKQLNHSKLEMPSHCVQQQTLCENDEKLEEYLDMKNDVTTDIRMMNDLFIK